MAKLYHTSLDELIEFDPDVQELQEWIDQTPDSVTDKIDWTQTWAKKISDPCPVSEPSQYPALRRPAERYAGGAAARIRFDEQDAHLVLKDILAQVWKSRKNRNDRIRNGGVVVCALC